MGNKCKIDRLVVDNRDRSTNALDSVPVGRQRTYDANTRRRQKKETTNWAFSRLFRHAERNKRCTNWTAGRGAKEFEAQERVRPERTKIGPSFWRQDTRVCFIEAAFSKISNQKTAGQQLFRSHKVAFPKLENAFFLGVTNTRRQKTVHLWKSQSGNQDQFKSVHTHGRRCGFQVRTVNSRPNLLLHFSFPVYG